MDDPSLDLVLRARNGSKEAQEVLLERSLPGLHAFVKRKARGVVRERESVSDIVQSACREVLAHLPDHEFDDEAHFQNWLHQAALRKIIDRDRYWRAGRRDVARDAGLQGSSSGGPAGPVQARGSEGETPSANLMRQEDLEVMERALAKLPKAQRDVLVMHRFLGLSHADISGKIGRTEMATRALLHRAARSLTRILKSCK